MKFKNNVLPPYVKFSCHKVPYHSVQLTLQSSSCNCLVLITICSVLGRPVTWQSNLSATPAISFLLSNAKDSKVNHLLVQNYGTDIWLKTVSSCSRNLDPVTSLNDGHQWDISLPSHRCQRTLERTQRHMYLCNTLDFPDPRRNNYATYLQVLPVITNKEKRHPRSVWIFPKRLSTS